MLRIIILALLAYILYKLLLGPRKTIGREDGPGRKAATGPIRSEDILVEDPVCHTYIPRGQAIVDKRDGRIYHFCSEKCRDKFLTT